MRLPITPEAGSFDAQGIGHYSVWVDTSAFPNFSSTDYTAARTFADEAYDEGHEVFTDFTYHR